MSKVESNVYADEVRMIVEGFEYELCEECRGDIEDHTISPDPLGHAHAWCKPLCPLETEYGVIPGRVVYCRQPVHPGNAWCVEHLEMYGYPVR